MRAHAALARWWYRVRQRYVRRWLPPPMSERWLLDYLRDDARALDD